MEYNFEADKGSLFSMFLYPIIFISVKENKRVRQILSKCLEVFNEKIDLEEEMSRAIQTQYNEIKVNDLKITFLPSFSIFPVANISPVSNEIPLK